LNDNFITYLQLKLSAHHVFTDHVSRAVNTTRDGHLTIVSQALIRAVFSRVSKNDARDHEPYSRPVNIRPVNTVSVYRP